MDDPTGERSVDFEERSFAFAVLGLKSFEVALRSVQVAGADADAVGEDAKAEKVCAVKGEAELAFDGVDDEAEVGEIGFEGLAGVDEFGMVVAEEGEVIDVTQVAGGFEVLEDVVIEAAQVEVSEELASEVADGESFGAQWGEEVVAGEVEDLALAVGWGGA